MRDNRKTIYGLFFLVRTLRAIRGSWNSNGVSAIDSNRETRESREQKKGVSPVAPKRFEEESKEKVSPPLQGGNREP